MEIVRAKRAGACYGVQRALDMVEEVLAEGGRAYTLGPLIHNPQVVAELEAKGATAVKSVEDVASREGGMTVADGQSAGGRVEPSPTVVIRSHGVTPQVLESVTERGLYVVDATCPHVARAQRAAAELAQAGCRVIVVGEAGHPEVEGLTAWARNEGGKVDVVACAEDIPEGLYRSRGRGGPNHPTAREPPGSGGSAGIARAFSAGARHDPLSHPTTAGSRGSLGS